MGRLDTRYIIKLDTKATFLNPTLGFSINDTETSDLYIRVTNKHKLIDVSNMIPVIVVIDPHGQLYSDFMEVTEDNLLYYDVKKTMKSQSGKHIAKVMLVDNQEKKVLKGNFSYIVEDDEISLLDEKAGEDDRLPILTEFISRLSTIENLELSRQEAETNRVEAEKQRELVKEKLISDIEKLIADTNSKVDTNLKENSNKVTKLIEDTVSEIDTYKSEKDTAINLDLTRYKDATTEDINTYKENKNIEIDNYKNAKDTEINKSLSDYKTNTTADIETYKTEKDDQIDNYIATKNKEIDDYKLLKDSEINKHVADSKTDLDNYKVAKNAEIDEYKNLKDTLINSKVKEIDDAKTNMVSSVNSKITEVDNKKNELTSTVTNKIAEADTRIQQLQGFESQLGQIETKNEEQDNRLKDVEYTNKRQDVMLNGLFNENADGRLTIDGEGNHIKLEHSQEGIIEVNKVVGNTLVNLYKNHIKNFHADYIFANSESLDLTKIKPNTKYTTVILGCDRVYSTSICNNTATQSFYIRQKGSKYCFTTPSDFSLITDPLRVYCYSHDINNKFVKGDEKKIKVILLEGDYTNKPIPTEYFEGMQSTFEDKIVTQEMVDSGEELAENLGKYKVDVKVVGKNLFDGKIVQGTIADATASEATVPNSIRSGNFVKVEYGKTYYLKYDALSTNAQQGYPKIYYYDANMNYLVENTPITIGGGAFTITNRNCKFIKFRIFAASQYSLTPDDISNAQLEEGTVATQYEPYKESKQVLYLDEPLYKDNELCIHNGQLGYWKKSVTRLFKGGKDEQFILNDANAGVNTLSFQIPLNLKVENGTDILNTFAPSLSSGLSQVDYEGVQTYNDNFLIRINKNKLSTQDSEGLRQHLQVNNVQICFNVLEPVFVPILDDTPQWILDSYNSCTVHFETNVPILSSSFKYTGGIPSVMVMDRSISDIKELNVDMVATTWDMDYRLLEVEWTLEDLTGVQGINLVSTLNLNNIKSKGEKMMALSRYEQAKIMILGGAYDKETLTRQLTRYVEKKIITQTEYDELIALMEAKELVTGE